jgi:glycosyltransferase involved in cell wall biosynthesis
MRVLLLSLQHPELVRGGAQQICYELFNALKACPGVKPTLLASVDTSFPALYKSGAYITGFDGREGEFLYLSRHYDYTWHKTSSPELMGAYEEFLESVRPDVVHFHHFHLFGIDLLTLTRKVLPATRLVFTFHEFMAICAANGQMLRMTDQSLCSVASSVRCHQCFPEFNPEHFFIREMWFKKHLSVIDVFTVPSRFMVDRYVEWGIDRDKIRHVTNGQPDYSGGNVRLAKRDKRNRVGFFGQLVDNKGVWLLLQAVAALRADGFTDFVIEINGDNLRYASEARRREFESFLAAETERPFEDRNVFYNGSYSVDQLKQRMSRVDWCVVPSVWSEAFGLVISEAWMFGRPVIGSNTGGPGERIRHDVDGLLFDVGDASSLASALRRATTERGIWERLSSNIVRPTTAVHMAEKFLETYKV